jgi:hypothetical protein
MFIKIKRGWEMPERDATPEGVYLKRRIPPRASIR